MIRASEGGMHVVLMVGQLDAFYEGDDDVYVRRLCAYDTWTSR